MSGSWRRLLLVAAASATCVAPQRVTPTRMICPRPRVAPPAWRRAVTEATHNSGFRESLSEEGFDSIPPKVVPVADSSLCARIAGGVLNRPGFDISGLQAFSFGHAFLVYSEGPTLVEVTLVDSTYQVIAGHFRAVDSLGR